MILFHRLSTVVFLMFLLFLPSQASAKTNMLFILDGSNSMWGQVEGKTKIKSAQDVLTTLLTDLPGDTSVGLMSYGHRDKSSCTDIELLSPIGMDKSDALVKKIQGIQPKGKTPIAAALKASINAFARHEGENNHVILISDGLESCNGDPCAAAGMLASANIKARVHVVGFDVGAEERKKLECISKQGNGKYFSASNAKELKLAVAEVKKEAIKPKPEVPVAKEYFRDDFDGDKLAAHWELLNPNPDAYIVEGGKLVMITKVAANLTDGKAENTLRLKKSLPDGDWDAVIKFLPEVQTLQERVSLSYMKDGKNQLVAFVDMGATGSVWAKTFLHLHGQKYSKGKATSFNRVALISPEDRSPTLAEQVDWFKKNARAVYLKISKRGRTYVASIKIEGDATTSNGKSAEWISLQKLTSLRLPGTNLVLSFPQRNKTAGESIIAIDWVKIVTHQ